MKDLIIKIKTLFLADDIHVEPIVIPDKDNGYDVFHISSREGNCIVKIAKTTDVSSSQFWFGLDEMFGLTI